MFELVIITSSLLPYRSFDNALFYESPVAVFNPLPVLTIIKVALVLVLDVPIKSFIGDYLFIFDFSPSLNILSSVALKA